MYGTGSVVLKVCTLEMIAFICILLQSTTNMCIDADNLNLSQHFFCALSCVGLFEVCQKLSCPK